MREEIDKGSIVAVYKFGNTTVRIDNSCVCKTPEEREKADREVAMAAWSIIDELIERGEEV